MRHKSKLFKTSLSKNMSLSLIARVITLVTGLIIQREILLAFGSVLNGLTSSISQVMSYLILLEAGLGTASIQALYAPLANDDWDKVSGILSATRIQYKRIAGVFIIILLAVSALLPFLIIDEVDYGIAALLTLVTGGSYVLSYIVGGKYKAILSSDRKLYVLYILEILSVTISCVFRVIALRMGAGIVLVQLINLATVLIKNIGYVVYVKKRYKKIDHSAAPDHNSTSKRKSVLVHSIASVVVNHTDIIILTIFSTMSMVSVYNVYNLVFAQFATLFQSTFGNALQGNLGRVYNKDKELFKKNFAFYEAAFTALLFLVSSIALIMILPFVELYTRGVTDANYIDPWLPPLFALVFLMNAVRIPTITAINVAGAFKETQKDALAEAIINLVISLALFFLGFGMYGLLIGTIVSYIYRTSTSIIYAYKHILKRKMLSLVKTVGANTALVVALYILLVVVAPITVSSWLEWILDACLVSVICIAIFGAVNAILNGKQTKQLLTRAKSLLKKH